MSSFDYSDDIIWDRLKALCRGLDQGPGPGKLKIFDGARPAVKGGPITTQNLLSTNFFQKPSAGTLTPNTVQLLMDSTPVLCVYTGVASWARFESSDGIWCADADVGVLGSGYPVQITQLQLYLGGEVIPTIGALVEI